MKRNEIQISNIFAEQMIRSREPWRYKQHLTAGYFLVLLFLFLFGFPRRALNFCDMSVCCNKYVRLVCP